MYIYTIHMFVGLIYLQQLRKLPESLYLFFLKQSRQKKKNSMYVLSVHFQAVRVSVMENWALDL